MNTMNGIFAIIFLIFPICQNQFIQNILPNFPDAIRCCGDSEVCSGAIYYLHASCGNLIHYVQPYQLEDRRVIFNADGTFNNGLGDLTSRRGCQQKTIYQLKNEGRTFIIGNKNTDLNLQILKQQLKQLKKEIQEIKRGSICYYNTYQQPERTQTTPQPNK